MKEARFTYTALTNCGENHITRPVKFTGTKEQINALRDEYALVGDVVTNEKMELYREAVRCSYRVQGQWQNVRG